MERTETPDGDAAVQSDLERTMNGSTGAFWSLETNFAEKELSPVLSWIKLTTQT